jgi:hypothetical protein
MDELCDRFLTLKAKYKDADANAKARPTKANKKMADTLVWNMLVAADDLADEVCRRRAAFKPTS